MGRARFSDVSKTASVLLLWTVFACSCWRSAAGEGVTDVTLEQWDDTITKNPYVLLLVYEPDCLTCEDAKKVLNELPEPDMFPGEMKKVQSGTDGLAGRYHVTALPGFVLIRNGDPVLYDGDISLDAISTWLMTAHQVATRVLNDDSFEHLTQAATGATTGDWLVLYYQPSCVSCVEAMAALEVVGVKMKGKLNVAKIDMDSSPKLVDRMKITKCPSAMFYRQGKMYRYEVDKYDSLSLTTFVQGWYKNMKAESVPVEPSAFDRLTDSIALALKTQLQGPNRTMFLGVVGVVAVVIVIIVVVALGKARKADKHKEP